MWRARSLETLLEKTTWGPGGGQAAEVCVVRTMSGGPGREGAELTPTEPRPCARRSQRGAPADRDRKQLQPLRPQPATSAARDATCPAGAGPLQAPLRSLGGRHGLPARARHARPGASGRGPGGGRARAGPPAASVASRVASRAGACLVGASVPGVTGNDPPSGMYVAQEYECSPWRGRGRSGRFAAAA